MFKLHDRIPATPEGITKSELATANPDRPTTAEVIYIHPLGRFYILEFKYQCGTIRETRYFTDAELEAGKREGLFAPAFCTQKAGSRVDNYGFDDDLVEMMRKMNGAI